MSWPRLWNNQVLSHFPDNLLISCLKYTLIYRNSDLAWLEDEKLAIVLSRYRRNALPTIIVDSESTVISFKKHTSFKKQPISFLPFSTSLLGILHDSTSTSFLVEPSINISGFLGFAVNLFCLRKEHEHFRKTILVILFKDLMVFESKASMNEYRSTLNLFQRDKFLGVALDQYSNEELLTIYPRFASRNPRPDYSKMKSMFPISTTTLVSSIQSSFQKEFNMSVLGETALQLGHAFIDNVSLNLLNSSKSLGLHSNYDVENSSSSISSYSFNTEVISKMSNELERAKHAYAVIIYTY
jgi:hypothetical protein